MALSTRARRRPSRAALFGSVVVAVILVAACSPSSSKAGRTDNASAGVAPSGALAAESSGTPAPQATTCADYEQYMGHSGKTVTIFGASVGSESDSLNKSWAQFEQCTGITIEYEGSDDFESQLPARLKGGTEPDLAIIGQPGLLAQLVRLGAVKKPPQGVVDNEDKYWNAAWKQYGSVDGVFYAAPQSANLDSLVWYSPTAFQQAGYQVPTTWSDLMALSDKVAADHPDSKPWCGGIGSGTTTGWPAADWLGEVVLGQYGAQVYDAWVSHKIPFASPQIEGAMKTVADWMQNPAYVNGGFGDVSTIVSTTFQDAGRPILTGKCWMLQQSSLYEAQWPTGTKIGPDGAVYAFKLPPVDPSMTSDEVEGGGEFTTAFSDRPEVQAVQTYLSSPQWADSRIKIAPGWVSANEGVDQSLYSDPIDQLSAKYLTDPKATFRFDASDLMPAVVGSGADSQELTNWFAQGESIDAVAKAVDAAWPPS